MITFSHVTKTYRTNIGLEDVSVNISKGDFVFLVGPSGAGKSTFIKLILKEIDADEGSITVDGQEVTSLSNREVPELRRKIGTVFQDRPVPVISMMMTVQKHRCASGIQRQRRLTVIIEDKRFPRQLHHYAAVLKPGHPHRLFPFFLLVSIVSKPGQRKKNAFRSFVKSS